MGKGRLVVVILCGLLVGCGSLGETSPDLPYRESAVAGSGNASGPTTPNPGSVPLSPPSSSTGLDLRLSSFFFADTTHGWIGALPQGCGGRAVSDCRGLLFRTEDGGDSWHQAYSGDVAPLAMQFGPDGIGWIAGGPASVGTYTSRLRGAAGTLLLTTDNGESWEPAYSGEGADGAFLSVSFTSETDGWIGTATGRLLHTVDGGKTWTQGSASCANWVSFVTPDHGFAFCGFPTNPGPGMMSKSFLRTTDSGTTWQLVDSVSQPQERRAGGLPFTGYGSGFTMRTKTDGWIALSRGGLLHTTDAGATWEGVYRGVQTIGAEDIDYSEAQGVQFLTESHGFALFNRRYLMETTDGGSTWKVLLDVIQLQDSLQN